MAAHRYPQNGNDPHRSASEHWAYRKLVLFDSTTHCRSDRLLQFRTAWIANLMRRSADRLQLSSEGQKFEVRADSLNATTPLQIFGRGKGECIHFREARTMMRTAGL